MKKVITFVCFVACIIATGCESCNGSDPVDATVTVDASRDAAHEVAVDASFSEN